MMQQEENWKTEQYHGAKIMVMAQIREVDNPALDGHGQAWDYFVSISDENTSSQDSSADARHTVRSDQNVFFSTQVIAEQMGFVKGRELVDHRTPTTPNPNAAAQATDGIYSANAGDRGEHGKSAL